MNAESLSLDQLGMSLSLHSWLQMQEEGGLGALASF